MQKVLFKIHGTTFMINPEMVVFISADKSYCKVRLSNGELIRVSKNLKYVLNQFVDVVFFFRIHRSNVVNLKFVEKIIRSKSKHNGYEVVLSTGDKLSLSAKVYLGFLESFKENIN